MVVSVACGRYWACGIVLACTGLLTACGGGGGSSERAPPLPELVDLPQEPFPEGRWNGDIGVAFGNGEGLGLSDGSAWFLVRDSLTAAIGVMVTRPAGSGGASVPAYGRFLDMMLDTITPVAFEVDAPAVPDIASGETVYDYEYGFGTRKSFWLERSADEALALADVVGHYSGRYLAGVERYLGMPVGSVGITIDAAGNIRGMTRDMYATCNLEGQISESTRGSAYEIRLHASERSGCPLIGLDVAGIAFLSRVGNGLLVAMIDEDDGVMAGLDMKAVSEHPMLPPGLFDYLP